jgi:long-chain acyl-CoA synthetase
VDRGERVAILGNTRAEWTLADLGALAAGAVVVPVYHTNSPQECRHVLAHSGARVLFCEDREQLAKVVSIRDDLPELIDIVLLEGEAPDALSLAGLRQRGAELDGFTIRQRALAVAAQDPATVIYTSGTTGPPKGCVLTHGNYRDVVSMCEATDLLGDEDVVYLYLPLAHSFALLIQLGTFELGSELAVLESSSEAVLVTLTVLEVSSSPPRRGSSPPMRPGMTMPVGPIRIPERLVSEAVSSSDVGSGFRIWSIRPLLVVVSASVFVPFPNWRLTFRG